MTSYTSHPITVTSTVFLAIARTLLDRAEEAQVEAVPYSRGAIFRLKVATTDKRRLKDIRSKAARTLRQFLLSAGAKHNMCFTLTVL